MERRRTPREKKDLAYRKDHHVNAEYPHPFRHQWMAAFFARHPEWKPRLRGWIANRLA